MKNYKVTYTGNSSKHRNFSEEIKEIYLVRDAETGTAEMGTFATIEEAKAQINAFEETDEDEGTYTPNSYEIFNTETEQVEG